MFFAPAAQSAIARKAAMKKGREGVRVELFYRTLSSAFCTDVNYYLPKNGENKPKIAKNDVLLKKYGNFRFSIDII